MTTARFHPRHHRLNNAQRLRDAGACDAREGLAQNHLQRRRSKREGWPLHHAFPESRSTQQDFLLQPKPSRALKSP